MTVTADAVFELTRPDAKTRQVSSVLEQASERAISSCLGGGGHRRTAVKDLEAYQSRKSRRRGRLTAAMNDIAEADPHRPQP